MSETISDGAPPQETLEEGDARVDTGTKIALELRRTLRGLVIATIVLYLAVAAVAGYSYYTSHRNQVAVCRLRDDLQRRVDSSKDFLIKHPAGLPHLGITRAAIVKEISNQERTLHALSVVSCN